MYIVLSRCCHASDSHERRTAKTLMLALDWIHGLSLAEGKAVDCMDCFSPEAGIL